MRGLSKAYEKDGIEGAQMYCVVSFIPMAVAYAYLLKTYDDDNLRKCLDNVINFYKCEVVD